VGAKNAILHGEGVGAGALTFVTEESFEVVLELVEDAGESVELVVDGTTTGSVVFGALVDVSVVD